ncbi:protein CUSTOS [Spea bombifrons]|uniref:protein CUSTOS n=1 Tax=Spea bombifrons TaxID=233779 RepID=UPI00234A874C|nr:protein CUSTOS [Spea bombifrons]
MAAPRKTSPDSDSDSSDEDLERFREAAWEPPGVKSFQHKQDAVAPAIPSLRVQVDCHDHDGNELQTTPEFRSHVAKKLTAILDSSIKEIPATSMLQNKSATVTDEDDGFRLFCTSVPGDMGAVTPATNSRRKMVSSSSEDSEEEERRCREAAVSGSDILRNSALQQVHLRTSDSTDSSQPCAKKHKKKKKQKKDDHEEGEEDRLGTTLQVEPESNGQGMKKKKKKKTKEILEEEEAQNIEENRLQIETESNGQSSKKKKKKQKVDM